MRCSLFQIASFLIMFASSAIADPITIAGINWSQTSENQQALIKDKGLVCSDFREFEVYSRRFLEYQRCAKGDAYIGVLEDQIRYGCALFEACDSDVESVAQKLVNDGKVRSMRGEFLYKPQYADDALYKYCGDGDDGDALCIYPSLEGTFGVLVIEKRSYGKNTDFN